MEIDYSQLYRQMQQQAQRDAERIAELQAITAALGEVLTAAQVAEVVVGRCLVALNASGGAIVLLGDDGETLEVVGAAGHPATHLDKWSRFGVDAPLPLAEVVRTGEPLLLESQAARNLRFPNLAVLASIDHAWASLPLIAHGRVLGGLGLSFPQPRLFDNGERGFMLSLAQQCAQAFERAQLYDAERSARAAAEEGRQRLAFLADASSLLADTLDYEATLAQLISLIVPLLADWCAIDLLPPFAPPAQSLVVCGSQEQQELLRELRRRYGSEEQPSSDWLLYQQGQRVFLPLIDEELLATLAQDDAHLRLLQQLDPASVIVLPLIAHGHHLGTIWFGGGTARRRYTHADLSLAEELTRRAAVALDNARLYRESQQAQQRAERSAERTARLQAITAALAGSLTPGEVAGVIVKQGIATLGAQAGVIVLLSADGTELEVVQTLGYNDQATVPWRRFALDAPVPLAEAVRTGEVIVLNVREAAALRYPLIAAAMSEEPRHQSMLAIPMLIDGRAIGAMGLSLSESQPFDQDDRAFLQTLAQQCAQALERSRLYEVELRSRIAAEQAQQRQTFLSEASAMLVSSLDYQATLNNVAHLAVPVLADVCVIDLASDDLPLRRVAVAHVDPAKEQLLYDMALRYPPASRSPQQNYALLEAGQPVLIPEVTDATIDLVAQNEEHAALIRAVGPHRSIMVMPLMARGRLLGRLAFGITVSDRQYTPQDLTLAADLARRAALAIDNALLYQEAQEAIGLRDQFLLVASHELKTPLTSLLGYAQLLERRALRDGTTSKRDQHTMHVLVEQATRLNKMIGALFDISRIQSGQLNIERAPLDLAALVRRVMVELQPTMDTHTLRWSVSAEPLLIEGDELRLEQVLQNLIQNAIKYSPAGGVIAVELVEEDGAACVMVTDQGLGIPTAALPHLFERFYRASNVHEQQIVGIGVGLYVVKEIVTLHGGTVEVSSTEGEGSTFTIRLVR